VDCIPLNGGQCLAAGSAHLDGDHYDRERLVRRIVTGTGLPVEVVTAALEEVHRQLVAGELVRDGDHPDVAARRVRQSLGLPDPPPPRREEATPWTAQGFTRQEIETLWPPVTPPAYISPEDGRPRKKLPKELRPRPRRDAWTPRPALWPGVDHREERDTFIRDLLRDGDRPAREMIAALDEAKIPRTSWRRCLRRLGVRHERRGFGAGSSCWWSLPDRPSSHHDWFRVRRVRRASG
jgi:hypothetical protein